MADNIRAVPKREYAPKSFNRDTKYVVDGYQYPNDLMGLTTNSSTGRAESNYGSNYVIFYINVNNESKMLENPEIQSFDIGNDQRIAKQLAGRNIKDAQAVGAIVAQSGGAVALGKAISGGGIGSALATGAVASAVPALGAASVLANTKNSTFSRPQKRLKSVISLHVPNQLSIRYGAGWSEEETFAMQALVTGGKEAARALEEAGKALTNGKMDEAKSSLVGGGKTISSIVANAALSKGPSAGALSAMTGLAPNPMKEQVFKGVDFRTFTMEYQFAPRSVEESDNVNNIIQAFKYHMHPEFKDSNNFLYLYPSEFDIEYYHGGTENMNIHRHTSCVLTELNINYTPNGNFSTFVGGRPTQINVSLTFKELTVLTKELIQQGL